MAKTLEHFAFTPPEGLESKEYSPTYPESEEAIRAQLQGIPNQLRDKLNALIDALSDETTDASGADCIGTGAIPGLTSRRVGGQLRELFTLMQNTAAGAIPDGSVGTEKLIDGTVTTEKLADGAVSFEKLADSTVDTLLTNSLKMQKGGTYTGTGKNGNVAGYEVTVVLERTDCDYIVFTPDSWAVGNERVVLPAKQLTLEWQAIGLYDSGTSRQIYTSALYYLEGNVLHKKGAIKEMANEAKVYRIYYIDIM